MSNTQTLTPTERQNLLRSFEATVRQVTQPPNTLICQYCGGDPLEPNHEQYCDGRQGHVEATAEYLDAAESHRRSEAGISRSFNAAKERDKQVAQSVINALAHDRPFFTSEDIWIKCALVDGHTIDPKRGSFIGHILRAAAKDGLIRLLPADFPSERPANHKRILRVWRSLVYRGPDTLPLCGACGQVVMKR